MARLMELVRQRDGNLDALAADLEKVASAAGADQYAARIALGRIQAENGNREAALAHLDKAARAFPKRPAAWQALFEMYEKSDPEKAREALERALPLLSGPEREMALRNLRDTSLDVADYEAAAKRHAELVRSARGNVFLKGELGRELLRRGETERALSELERVVNSSHGDNRALVPALRDLGRARMVARKLPEALETLRKAARLSAAQPGLRREIDELRAEAHAAAGTLREYIAELEAAADDGARQELVGRLYEQEGNPEGARKAYRAALDRDPKNIDIRLRLVRLLELTGKIDEATKQYGELTRAAPSDVNLALRHMEMLLAQGARERVLREFDRIERRTRDEPNAAFLLADFAHRLEEPERERAILARLEQRGLRDPRHLIELGNRAYREGNQETARKLWQRVISVHSDRAKAYVLLGEALLDHEDPEKGVEALEKAAELQPGDLRITRSLALGLQRAAAQAEKSKKATYEKKALQAWQTILASGTSSRSSSDAEARRQIVRLWRRTGQLGDKMAELSRRFDKADDLAAGRLLAEAEVQLGRHQAAERTLDRLLQAQPGDRRSLEKLESIQAKTGRYEAATATLKKLVQLDPGRARHYYERMARYALREKNDDQALLFAEEAVRLDPGDAEAQARLGDLYADQGKLTEAERAYRAALSKDDRLNDVSLRLARLLTKRGKIDEALELSFHVLRTDGNESVLSRAGRLALGISVPAGKAEQMELVLRPLAISHPQKGIYRQLLLETLAAEMYPLVQSGSAAELRSLAERNLQPLLAAIADDQADQHRVAIELLGYGESRQAGGALVEFASSSADGRTRVAAILSAGRLADPALVPRLAELLVQEEATAGGPLARAAAWSLAHLGDAAAMNTLVSALASGDPIVRAYAVLGLGALQREIRALDQREIVRLLTRVLSDANEGPLVRAAAAAGLSRSLPSSETDAALLAAAGDHSEEVARHALVALILRSPQDPQTLTLAADALVRPEPRVAAASAWALAAAHGERPDTPLVPPLAGATIPEVGAHLDALLEAETMARGRARALTAIEAAYQKAAAIAASTSKAGGIAVAHAIRPSREGLALRPLVESVSPADATAHATLLRIRAELTPVLASLVKRSQDAELRRAALSALTLGTTEQADRVFRSVVLGGSGELQETALLALAQSEPEAALNLLEDYLRQENRWTMRRRAVSTLQELAQRAEGKNRRRATTILQQLARDPNPLVSEHAREALR